MNFIKAGGILIIAILLFSSCSRPLLISHIGKKKEQRITNNHGFMSPVICWKEQCRDRRSWTSNRGVKFKGFDDAGAPPKVMIASSGNSRPAKPQSQPAAAEEPETIQQEVSESVGDSSPPVASNDEAGENMTHFDPNKTYRFESLVFDTGKSSIKDESKEELDELSYFLLMNRDYNITITGHTDNTGNEHHNLRLSKDRANQVARYLTLKGIDVFRITSEGNG